MKNAILALLGKTSVDSLTSAFQKTIQRLGEVEQREAEAIQRRQCEIDDLENANDDSRREAARASALVTKLSKLIA